MTRKNYQLLAGIIFLVIVVLHGLRLVYGWPATINNLHLPLWVSVVAVVVAAIMAYFSFKLRK